MKKAFPILEFDPEPNGIIHPSDIVKPIEIPEACVLCFFSDILNKLRQRPGVRLLKNLRTELGVHPVFAMDLNGQEFAVMHPGIGGPLCAVLFEEVIQLGCRKFIACGSAGVLDGSVAMGKVLVPTAAVRDEGTSYHYLPPGREVEASPQAVQAIEQVFAQRKIDYLLTKTWTTDAIYRETPAKIAARKAEGCLAVEMEAAALFAVAQFRKVSFGQILYAGDDVSGEQWRSRDWIKQKDIREKLFELAAEASLAIK